MALANGVLDAAVPDKRERALARGRHRGGPAVRVGFIPSNCLSKSKQRTNHGHLYLPIYILSTPHHRNSLKRACSFRKQRCVPTIIGVSGRRLSKWLSRELIRLRGRGGWRLLRRVWNSNANRLWGTPPRPVPHSHRQRTAGHLRPQRPAAQQDKTVGRTELPRRDQTCRIVRLRPSIGS
jgi:hypothetical protein